MTKPEELPYQTVLAINTSDKETITLTLIRIGKKPFEEIRSIRAQDLQIFIDDFLKSQNAPIAKLNAIAIYRQADSLTGTRMGIASANTLAWLVNIPIIELDGPSYQANIDQLATSPEKFMTNPAALPLS